MIKFLLFVGLLPILFVWGAYKFVVLLFKLLSGLFGRVFGRAFA